MKRVKVDVRITVADTVSDVLVRLYKDASAKDGAIAKDAALSVLVVHGGKFLGGGFFVGKGDYSVARKQCA